jgi:hypothetical protein
MGALQGRIQVHLISMAVVARARAGREIDLYLMPLLTILP